MAHKRLNLCSRAEEKEALLARVSSLQDEVSNGQVAVQQLQHLLQLQQETVKDLEERIVQLMAEISDSEENHERR